MPENPPLSKKKEYKTQFEVILERFKNPSENKGQQMDMSVQG